MTRFVFATICLLATCLASHANAQDILFEDFEDSAVTYTSSIADSITDIGSDDYFGRLAPDTAFPNADIVYNNIQGNGYWGAQDMDGALPVPATSLELTFSANATDFENIMFEAFWATDTAADGNNDYDTADGILVEYRFDGGAWANLFAVEGENVAGDTVNELARVDTDFDGDGDGAVITDTFTAYSSAISGTGSTLDVRFTVNSLNAGDEDIAIDSVRISGDFVGVPEPGSIAFLLAAAVPVFVRRRR